MPRLRTLPRRVGGRFECPIQAMLLNVPEDARGNQRAELGLEIGGAALGEQLSDSRRRYVRQNRGSAGRARRPDPLEYERRGEARYLFEGMPFLRVFEYVGADHEAQLVVWVLPSDALEAVQGQARRSERRLDIADL